MGIHHTADIVPFIAHGIAGNRYTSAANLILTICRAWEDYSDNEDGEAPEHANEFLGWKNLGEGDMVGKRGKVYACATVVKGEHTVYLVNESPYRNKDEYSVAACSDSRDALQAFLEDFKEHCDAPSVEELDTVQYTS